MKNLIWVLLFFLCTKTISAQTADSIQQPVTATLRLSGTSFLQNTIRGNIMSTNFEHAPGSILSLRQYGLPCPKWQSLLSYYFNELPVSLNKSLYASWFLLRLTNENNVYIIDENAITDALLTNQGKFVGSDGESVLFSFPGIIPGMYYVEFIHRNSLTLFSAQKHYFSQGITDVEIGRPQDYYGGENAVINMGDGRYGMFGGDAYPDNFNDFGDYVPLYNDIFVYHASGFLFTDLDMSDSCTQEDMDMFDENLWKSAYSPYPPRKNMNRRESDNPEPEPVISVEEYELIAKDFINTNDSTKEFNIFLNGNFSINIEQLALRFDSTAFNGGMKTLLLTETLMDTSHIDSRIIGDKIVIGMAQLTPSIALNGGQKLCHVILSSSNNFIGDLNLKWVNYNDPRTKIWKTDSIIIMITDSTNHVIDNSSSIINSPIIVNDFVLYQNYPNPFNPNTIISYNLAKNNFVSLKVYNELGKEVTVLVNMNQESGNYSVKFDGGNLASGIYYYKLESGDFVLTKKMILIK